MNTATAPINFMDATNPDRHELAILDRVPTPHIRTRLLPLVKRKGLPGGKYTAAEIARAADVSEANLSWYLNWTPGEKLPFAGLDGFETSIAEWFGSMDLVKESSREGMEPFETCISKRILEFSARQRASGNVGVVYGDAGIGKSRALILLQEKMPRAVVLTAMTWNQGSNQLASALHSRLRLHDNRKSGSKMANVSKRLKDQPRLLVIDNAHQLNASAFRFLFNLNDMGGNTPERRCGIVLVGNPEIVDTLRDNDQFFSRLAQVEDLNNVFSRAKSGNLDASGMGQVAAICRKLVSQYLPGHEDELTPLAARVAAPDGGGRFRIVEKRLETTRDLLKTDSFKGKPAAAFRAAHASLVTRYQINLHGGES